jgi:hypothetical protein
VTRVGSALLRHPVAIAGGLWVLDVLFLATSLWLDVLLRRAGFPDLTQYNAEQWATIVSGLSAVTVGTALIARLPRHPVSWLLTGVGLAMGLQSLTYAVARYGLVARPGSIPGTGYVAGLCNALVLWPLFFAGMIFLLTPTGSPPSRRWRWLIRVAVAGIGLCSFSLIVHPMPLFPEYPAIGNPLAIPGLPLAVLDVLTGVGGIVTLLSLGAAVVSLLVRFARARGLVRQQLRWLTLAASLGPVAIAIFIRTPEDAWAVKNGALGLYLAALPLAIAASVTRYRLYDLDRIVSRTLAYALLTVTLAAIYAVLALVLGQLAGGQESLVVAAATLIVAAIFQPARRRVQRAVDRRFDRRRYDAARTIAAFSTRLRSEIDLDTLSAEVLAVVDETMQPAGASLWLRASHP